MDFNTANCGQNLMQIPVASKCVAIVLEFVSNGGGRGLNSRKDRHSRRKTVAIRPEEYLSIKTDGQEIFDNFRDENRISYWNPFLVESINMIEFVGYVKPSTMFVAGDEKYLECLKNAWIKRILKAPAGFIIKNLGDVGGIEIQEVPQTQFIPLPDVLCLIVSSLNRIGQPATVPKIVETLCVQYPDMAVPSESILRKTLNGLMVEGKVFCMKNHYFAPSLAMLQQYQKAFYNGNRIKKSNYYHENVPTFGVFNENDVYSPVENSHSTSSKECQTGASVANGLAPYKPKIPKNQAVNADLRKYSEQMSDGKQKAIQQDNKKEPKKEKHKIWPSILNRLFGRNGPKCKNIEKIEAQKSVNAPQPTILTFSAQFPPPEWMCNQKYPKSNGQRTTNHFEQQQGLIPDFNKYMGQKDHHHQERRPKSHDRPICFEPTSRYSPQRHRRHHRRAPRAKSRRRHSISYSSSSECLNYIMNYGNENYVNGYYDDRCKGRSRRQNRRKAPFLQTIDDETSIIRTSTPTTGSRSSRDGPNFGHADAKSAPNDVSAPPNSDNRDSAISSNSPRITDASLSPGDKARAQHRQNNKLGEKLPNLYNRWPGARYDHVYVNVGGVLTENLARKTIEQNFSDVTAENHSSFSEHFYENISSRPALLGGGHFRRSIDETMFENANDEDGLESNFFRRSIASKSFNSL